MTHTFIVNTENVNEYGYRVLTDGIDYKQYLRNPIVLFMHERHNSKERGSEIIGKVVKLYVQDKKLIADIEFDEKDAFAKKIADKVEGGFIRMASMYADVKATSTDPELILQGQTHETVTACKLQEISIVDIGGNDDAIKLSKDGEPIQLKKVNINKTDNMSNFKTIALALALDANTDETALLAEIKAIKLAKETADNKVVKLENDLKAIRLEESTSLVDKAISLGLIPEVFKPTTLQAFEADFDGQKAILSKLITDAEAEGKTNNDQSRIKEVVLAGKGNPAGDSDTETFDYLQKHDTVKLAKIRDENPTQYEKIAKAYANGVRYTPKQ